MTANKRSYRSPRREAQAQETRALILASARALFTSRGYAGTTIEAVAAEAGSLRRPSTPRTRTSAAC